MYCLQDQVARENYVQALVPFIYKTPITMLHPTTNPNNELLVMVGIPLTLTDNDGY
jgi:hypothetical protein